MRAALLLADPESCSTLILYEDDRKKFKNISIGFHKQSGEIRKSEIFENLIQDGWIIVDPNNSSITLSDFGSVPDLDFNPDPLIPFVIIATQTYESRLEARKRDLIERQQLVDDLIDAMETEGVV